MSTTRVFGSHPATSLCLLAAPLFVWAQNRRTTVRRRDQHRPGRRHRLHRRLRAGKGFYTRGACQGSIVPNPILWPPFFFNLPEPLVAGIYLA